MGLLQKRDELLKNEMISASSVRYCQKTNTLLLTLHPSDAVEGFLGCASSVPKCRRVNDCNDGDGLC